MKNKRWIQCIFILVLYASINVVEAQAKSATMDYFTIENAYDDLLNTCVEGDYIYILNATELQKISLQTGSVVAEISYPLLTSVTEFMRKGPRIYFDAYIDSADTIVCVDIESFTELGRVLKNEFTPNWAYGLANIEYHEIDDVEFWVWMYIYLSGTTTEVNSHSNIYRGRYGTDYEWSLLLGTQRVGNDMSGKVYLRHYRYNETGDYVNNTEWDLGAPASQYISYYCYGSIYFNGTHWVGSAASKGPARSDGLYSNPAKFISLQHEYDGTWLDVTWGEFGVRNNPTIDSGPTMDNIDWGVVFLDVRDRVVRYTWDLNAPGDKAFQIARFDRASGFIVYASPKLLNSPNFTGPDDRVNTWGQMAFIRLDDSTDIKRSWIGYVNATDLYPKAERVVEVGGSNCIASGTIEEEGYIPTATMIYKADRNLVAIFRNTSDTDDLHVCRNLIDRDLLKTEGYLTPLESTVTLVNLHAITEVGIGVNGSDSTEYWVFEGKERYEISITYQNLTLTSIDQIGIRFNDSVEDYHTIWYDQDAHTLTVTSPNDGISGWLSSIEQSGDDVIAVFEIMFNKPIPDTYNVQLESRVVEDFDRGWAETTGGLFNIYNLGGLSTLTASGTAGRVTGGDVFEIYAADTRTNIAGTENFDVRASPLSWYNVLTNEDLLINELPPHWDFNIPRRVESVTIRLTNNLPENRTSPETRGYPVAGTDDMAYVSYPFSMRLLSDPFLTGDYQISSELTFPRELTSADGTLCVQAYMMNPNTTTTTGAFWVRDGSRLVSGTKILSDVQFNGNGTWVSYNSTASSWVYYGNYTAYTWYNVTVAIDLSGKTYDIFIDDVEVVSDLPYRNPAATTAYVVEFSQFVPVAGAPADSFTDFYVDDVRQWTGWDADYGGIAKATMLFKHLQHWSMDFDFFVEEGKEYAQGPTATPSIDEDDYSDYGYLEFGWDIVLNGTYINDFLVARVNITDGKISGKNDWVEFNVTWYQHGEYIKNDLLYGLFEGYSLFPGSSKDTSGFHWDIWFNRANASTVLGARLNTEYFGMSDKSVWWAVWSSKWQPMRTEVSDSTVFIDLEDVNGTTHSAKDTLFVRSWVEVYRNAESTFSYKVLNIGDLNFLVAIDTMSGIDTPPVRETKVPDVSSGFFGSALGSIFSAALKRLGNTLAGFGMEFFTLSIAFVDNVFAALGYPALVSTIFTWMDSLFASVPALLGYGLTLIGNLFTVIDVTASDALNQISTILTIWVGMYNTFGDFMAGVYTPGLNLWNDLGVDNFIKIVAILYPFYLVLLWTEKGGQAVIDQVNSILNIGSFFLNLILNVGGFFISLLDTLIGAIRG